MTTNLIPPAGAFGQVSFEGQRSYLTGSVTDNSQIVYLSMVGFKTANRALWAALMEKRNFIQIGKNMFRRIEGKYLHDEKPLPEIGMSHMLIVHSQATVTDAAPDKPFYLIGNDPNRERFYAMLNRALALPILPDWSEYLWAWGTSHGLIKELECQGIAGFVVNPDHEEWTECLTGGISGGRIR